MLGYQPVRWLSMAEYELGRDNKIVMTKKFGWSNLVIGVGLVLVFFSAPHLIDDFLYGIPEEFGLTNQQTQILAGIFHVQLIMFFVLVARERKAGYYGTLFWGIFLALAGILKHLPEIMKPEPYWSGVFSEILIIGIIIVGIVLGITSIFALLSTKEPTGERSKH
jgi:hypothetical protein